VATKYVVEGLHCEGCAKSVSKAIQSVASGAQVKVDVAGGLIEVAGAADSRAVVGAIEKAGYKVLSSAA
jgi:copper chaperone